MIIIDENIDQIIIDRLAKEGFEIVSIRDHNPGISDKQVIEIARSKNAIVITEDRDFGELVFSHNIRDCSILYLRYAKPDYSLIENNIINILKDYQVLTGHFFITITPKKIRIKKI